MRVNSSGVPILGIHWSAHPERTEEWRQSEQPKYSESMWRQEYELDDLALSGERVLADLLIARWGEIVITDSSWEADPHWIFGGGMDYGKAHPTSWHAYAKGFDGCRYALCEHFQSGTAWIPEKHTAQIHSMRAVFLRDRPLVHKIVRKTVCDPSMGYENIAQKDKFTSMVELFQDSGFAGITPGVRGGDLALVDEIRNAWSGSEVKFKILCRDMPFPIDPGSLKKREGTYENGCPNLLWELVNLRRKENSSSRKESVGPAEGLVDKENDAWDDLKYWWTSMGKATPEEDRETDWQKRLTKIKTERPNVGLNALIFARQKWEQENRQEVVTYR